MTRKIEQKITGYQVVKAEAPTTAETETTQPEIAQEPKQETADVIHMHERVMRPEILKGYTYKVSTPDHVSEHSLYITINDIILNAGTEHELERPFEVFINSKNMEHFQWIVALTRIISAVFRKGGDVTFLVEELKSVFDPRGGYWKKGGVFMPSLVAEIGDVIEQHLIKIGLMHAPELDEHQKQLIEDKRKEFALTPTPAEGEEEESSFPEQAQLCKKCSVKAAIVMDGCLTCLNCGDSKCG
ncbi:MAG: NrdJb [Pseudomonadales bacterium]|nr:NrdJb [Pseudomonadales bacterium]